MDELGYGSPTTTPPTTAATTSSRCSMSATMTPTPAPPPSPSAPASTGATPTTTTSTPSSTCTADANSWDVGWVDDTRHAIDILQTSPQHTTHGLGDWNGHVAAVELEDGNLTAETTDLAIATWGPPAELSRSYSSRGDQRRTLRPRLALRLRPVARYHRQRDHLHRCGRRGAPL